MHHFIVIDCLFRQIQFAFSCFRRPRDLHRVCLTDALFTTFDYHKYNVTGEARARDRKVLANRTGFRLTLARLVL